MSQIKNIEKIPEEVRELTEIGLGEALKKGSLGKMKINFIQIENSLSGGKTGAVVFVARYGFSSSDELPITTTKKNGKKKTEYQTNASIETTFVRVLKIAPKEICESENEGYVKTRETLLDIFSQVEYYTEDEFVHEKNDYGILLYQDVGTVAASDLKGIAKYFTNKILQEDNEHKPEAKDDSEKFSRELSLLMQKEVFLGIKKGLYGTVKRKDVNLKDYYGKKLLSDKVKQGLAELQKIDESIPDHATILNYFNINATYHEVNYVHGDLNPENVLVWENERGFLSCKLIDFGEVIPKKKDNFTPLFWDYSRLLGEMILNFVEEIGVGASRYTAGTAGSTRRPDSSVEDYNDKAVKDEIGHRVISDTSKEAITDAKNGNRIEMPTQESVDSILNEFWSVVEAFFKNDPSKLENANPKIEYISRIYLSTLFDFINEAKSGLKDLRRAEVMQDYFYCQILFFLFFAKFQKENPYKRLFGVKFALKLYEYANSGDAGLQSLIQSLEKLYFDFSSTRAKNKKPQIGPAVGARSPFMGLSYFQEKDKEFFFGREKFTEELLNAIEEKPIVALAGASGSGKSSVVHAGVIPKLREQGYLIYKFRPGANPYQAAMNGLIGGRPQPNFIQGEKSGSNNAPLLKEEGQPIDGSDLKELIGSILRSNPNNRLFLLGDQFEELFTLCTDTRQREDLGQALIDCAKEFKDSFRFFITIRSDFWTKLIEDASFASVVGDSGSNKHLGAYKFLNPMNVDELRSTIEKPLAVSKLFIQDGLTDLILTSISKEPGSLPLLEFCLHELWKDQVDYTLTYNTYKKIGEVKGALATYAEQVYSSLSADEQEQLKKIMLQLVQPGQGTEDTRRIALVEDVVGGLGVDRPHPDSSDSEKSGSNKTPLPKGEGWRSRGDGDSKLAFINTLADKRLIVTGVNETGKQTFEVVHEALIREWKRLKEWINADREFRVWQEKLRYAEKEWDAGKKDQNLLLRGINLLTAIDWYDTRKNDMGMREIEYIEASKARARRTKVILWSAGILVSSLILGFGVFGLIMYEKATAMRISLFKAQTDLFARTILIDFERRKILKDSFESFKYLKESFFYVEIDEFIIFDKEGNIWYNEDGPLKNVRAPDAMIKYALDITDKSVFNSSYKIYFNLEPLSADVVVPIGENKEVQLFLSFKGRSEPEIKPIRKEYAYLEKARKSSSQEEQIDLYKKALELNPNLIYAKEELALLYFNAGKEGEAFALTSEKEYLYLNRARKTEDTEKKIADYLEAIKINSKLIVAKSELAHIYINVGKEREAFELEKQKEYLYLYRARKSDGEKKIADYQEALKINSKFQPARVELAKFYYDNKNYIEAARTDSENHDYLNAGAWKLATKENPTPEELKEALEFSKKSNDLSKDNASYLDTLAEIYLKLGDKSNAKKYNDQARQFAQDKNNAELLKLIEEREVKLK